LRLAERMNACLTPEYSKLDMVNSKSDVLAYSRVAAKPLPAEAYKQFQTFEFREPLQGLISRELIQRIQRIRSHVSEPDSRRVAEGEELGRVKALNFDLENSD
jgi:hypothetical protein